MKRIVFIVDGGIGKVIMSTVPLRGIRKKYPDHQIIVVCGHPDVLLHNPNCDKVYHAGNTQYFYDDFILGSEATVLKQEPYLEPDYIYKRRHLTEIWCEILGVPFDNPKPDLFFTQAEKDSAKAFSRSIPKPLFILQTHGGPPQQRIFKRDIAVPLAEKVVSALSERYTVLHFRYNEQPAVAGTTAAFYQLRESMGLLAHAKNTLIIDSFLQHACAAMGLRANVVWGGTSPVVLGYESNNNIFKQVCKDPACHRPNSYLFDMVNGKPWDCPYSESCLKYEPEEILSMIGDGQEMPPVEKACCGGKCS